MSDLDALRRQLAVLRESTGRVSAAPLAAPASREQAVSDLVATLGRLRGGARPARRAAPVPTARPDDGRPAELRVIQRRLGLDGGQGRVGFGRFAEAVRRGEEHPAWPRHVAAIARDERLGAALATGALFLDTETTGLSGGAGTVAWLVGMAWLDPDGGGLLVEQLVLTEMAQERELLERVHERIHRASSLVTFNGKSFDVPLLETRFVLHRMRAPGPRPHLDLLAPSRRLFPCEDARLQTFERRVLGLERVDDIPSAEVPQAWFEFLRTGCSDDVERVIRHNEDDLLTMVALAAAVLELAHPETRPGASDLPHDALAVAELRARAGDAERAREWLAACAGAPEGDADAHRPARRPLRHARITKRLLGPAAALATWRDLVARQHDTSEPYEELAKVLEHRERDASAARRVVLDALARFRGEDAVVARLDHRLRRLDAALARPRAPGHDSRPRGAP